MVEKIKKILKELEIREYKLAEYQTESAELFFIRKELDVHRTTCIRYCRVTVYSDFEHDGEKCKGESVVSISADMNEDEIRKAVKDAYDAAFFVYTPFYELPEGGKEAIVESETKMTGKSLSDMAGIMTEALFKNDIYEKAFINSAELFVTRTTKRIVNSKGIDVGYVSGDINGEFVIQCLEPNDVESYECFCYYDLEPDMLSIKVAEAIERARLRANAVKMEMPENTDVILDGGCFRQIISYYTGRTYAEMIYTEYSEYKVGTDVGSRLSIDLKAVFPYDCNGKAIEDRPLLRDGIVETIYGAPKECYYLGIPYIGDYDFYRVKPGVKTIDELRKMEIKDGNGLRPYLRILTFSDFQSNQMSGEFGGEIRLAMYFDGEKEIPVTGGSINVSLVEHRDYEISSEAYSESGYEGPKEVRFFLQ